MPPLIVFYGDDFTGAADALAVAAQAGLRSRLFLQIPNSDELAAAGPLDWLGIAGTTRSLDNAAMEWELSKVARFFKTLGARIFHYGTSPSFPSTPETGSIALAVVCLRTITANPFLPIIGGDPALGCYCVFGNLFAAGSDHIMYRVDRHPMLSVDAEAPMVEADLREHLACQSLTNIASLPYTSYAKPPSALRAEIASLLAHGPEAILFDVARAEDLPVIGALLWQRANTPILAVGPGSVITALTQARGAMRPKPDEAAPGSARGPVFVLSASLSPVTRKQVQSSPSYTAVEIDAARLVAGGCLAQAEMAARICTLLAHGRNVLANTSSLAAAGARPIPAQALNDACSALVQRVARAARPQRVGLAGSATSCGALKTLGIASLSFLAALAPGVALCRTHAADPALDGIEIMLKGGQIGPPDIFERLLRGRAGADATAP